MAHKKGDRVKVMHSTPHMPKGAHGTIASTHTGMFHGVRYGSGVVYLPASHVNDPDNDNDNDAPGSTNDPDNDAVKASAEISEVIASISSRRRR